MMGYRGGMLAMLPETWHRRVFLKSPCVNSCYLMDARHPYALEQHLQVETNPQTALGIPC